MTPPLYFHPDFFLAHHSTYLGYSLIQPAFNIHAGIGSRTPCGYPNPLMLKSLIENGVAESALGTWCLQLPHLWLQRAKCVCVCVCIRHVLYIIYWFLV